MDRLRDGHGVGQTLGWTWGWTDMGMDTGMDGHRDGHGDGRTQGRDGMGMQDVGHSPGSTADTNPCQRTMEMSVCASVSKPLPKTIMQQGWTPASAGREANISGFLHSALPQVVLRWCCSFFNRILSKLGKKS